MSTQPSPGPSPAPQSTEKLPFPLQDGERVVRVCRRHWMYLWPTVALYSAFAVAPIVVAEILGAGGPGSGNWKYLWILIALWFVYWAVRAFRAWYRYRHDIWVITNQRLIDSYRKGLFDLRVATADLVNVQDMTIEKNGIFKTLLDYGDIVCQTAANQPDFRLTGVPNPRDTQILVDRERDRERQRYRS